MDSEVHLRRVLLDARLAGPATTEQLADRTGLPAADVGACLEECATRGWVRWRDGRIGGWVLTGVGRNAGVALLAAEVDAAGAQTVLRNGYRSFFELNPELLEVCTAWQLRPSGWVSGQSVAGQAATETNDHSDRDYDRGVVAWLRSIDERVGPVVGELGSALDRFSRYRPRFTHALERIEAGESDWFTRPVIDSYHTVWFELHEDLLATLGRERSDEHPTPEGRNTADDVGGAR